MAPTLSLTQVGDDLQYFEFGLTDPITEDFHSVKNMLNGYLGNAVWDVSGLATAISRQAEVGSMIKVVEEDGSASEALGMATIISLTFNKGNFIRDTLAFIKRAGGNVDALTAEGQHAGLLISRRAVGIPDRIITPLYTGLVEDLAFSTTEYPADAAIYNYTTFVVIGHSAVQSDQGKRTNAVLYAQPEDAILVGEADWSGSVDLGTSEGGCDLQVHVAIITREGYDRALARMKREIQ